MERSATISKVKIVFAEPGLYRYIVDVSHDKLAALQIASTFNE
jgi:hypothetical protein